jgi:hypothetical protein
MGATSGSAQDGVGVGPLEACLGSSRGTNADFSEGGYRSARQP